MTDSSDKAVIDYLDTMFFDVTLPPVKETLEIKPCDSIKLGCRILPTFDPFTLMNLQDSSQVELWESFLLLLVLGVQLPQGNLQRYVFNQNQVLYQKVCKIALC